MLTVILLNVSVLSVVKLSVIKLCHCTVCHHVECCYAERCSAILIIKIESYLNNLFQESLNTFCPIVILFFLHLAKKKTLFLSLLICVDLRLHPSKLDCGKTCCPTYKTFLLRNYPFGGFEGLTPLNISTLVR